MSALPVLGPLEQKILDLLLESYVDAYFESAPPKGSGKRKSKTATIFRGLDMVETRASKLFRDLEAKTEMAVEEVRRKAREKGWSPEKYQKELERAAVSTGKARTAARTEAAVFENTGEAERWADEGVSLVRISDGVKDEPCKYANGSVWEVETYAKHPIAHPNCQRTATPIPESEENRVRRFVKGPHPDERSMEEWE